MPSWNNKTLCQNKILAQENKITLAHQPPPPVQGFHTSILSPIIFIKGANNLGIDCVWEILQKMDSNCIVCVFQSNF